MESAGYKPSTTTMAKKLYRRTRKEKVKQAIRVFEKLAIGLVKIWMLRKGVPTPFIVAVEDVDAFCKQILEEEAK